jgi:hypothetical protein
VAIDVGDPPEQPEKIVAMSVKHTKNLFISLSNQKNGANAFDLTTWDSNNGFCAAPTNPETVAQRSPLHLGSLYPGKAPLFPIRAQC